MRLSILVRFSCVLVLLSGIASAADQQIKVTVATQEGDFINGVFKGASETEVNVAVAGQTITLPLPRVKYISFAGRITAGTEKPELKGTPEDAFAAFAELQDAIEIGLLRSQYADKILTTMPRVKAFLENEKSTDWRMVRGVMARAYDKYRGVLDNADSWKYASGTIRRADSWVKFAHLLFETKPKDYMEHDEGKTLGIGMTAKGILGPGDLKLPNGVLKNGDGYFDRYRLTVASTTYVEAEVTSSLGGYTRVAITTTNNGLIDAGGGAFSTRVRAKKKLPPGDYFIWVGFRNSGAIGSYTLTVSSK